MYLKNRFKVQGSPVESFYGRAAKLHSTGQGRFRVYRSGDGSHPFVKLQASAQSAQSSVISHHRFFVLLGALLFALCALPLPVANAATVTVGWDSSPDPVAGYEFCYGTTSGTYDYSVDVGNNTSCSISGLEEGTTYYFVARAYNSAGKSDYSAELVHKVPSSLDETGGNGYDRNTDIVIEAEDMSFHANGAQSQEYWLLWSNGTMSEEIYFPETGTYRFEITARGDLAWGVGPEMEVLIDGVKKGAVFVNTGTPNIYEFAVEVSAGSHNFDLGFSNDFYDPDQGIDRNLYVDNIVIYLTQEEGTPQTEPLKTIEIEAENGSMSYPFESESDDQASSGKFIWVPNGRGNALDPNQNSGYAEYSFSVPVAGDYVIWGCVLAKSRRDNSFFVSIDQGTYVHWNTKRSKSWTWDQVSDRGASNSVIYHLELGSHTLTIKQREDGTKLDKILITGDLTYIPD